jgi:hypothetical protein
MPTTSEPLEMPTAGGTNQVDGATRLWGKIALQPVLILRARADHLDGPDVAERRSGVLDGDTGGG